VAVLVLARARVGEQVPVLAGVMEVAVGVAVVVPALECAWEAVLGVQFVPELVASC